jgi:pantoate--beta-alanine ligase
VREPDGLAMSSRNAYLNGQQRKSALVLNRSLAHIRELFQRGERDGTVLITAGKHLLREDPSVRLDYFEIVHPETLDPVAEITQNSLVAVAAYVGTTRLIDNILLG